MNYQALLALGNSFSYLIKLLLRLSSSNALPLTPPPVFVEVDSQPEVALVVWRETF
jgi:hypothetical protein